MHTVQLLLVEDTTHQNAIASAENFIADWEGHWSDWSEVGGRWKGIFGEMNPDVICYADDPELFEKHLKESGEARVANLKSDYAQLEKSYGSLGKLVESYNPTIEDFALGMGGYYARKIGSVISDYWTCDSCFYDITGNSAGLNAFRSRVAEKPREQFMVAVDFHF
jgi:hypothetical protein